MSEIQFLTGGVQSTKPQYKDLGKIIDVDNIPAYSEAISATFENMNWVRHVVFDVNVLAAGESDQFAVRVQRINATGQSTSSDFYTFTIDPLTQGADQINTADVVTGNKFSFSIANNSFNSPTSAQLSIQLLG